MSGEISLDLVICTYNNARLLDVTLAAIRRQRVSPGVAWGVLVVNNNCTDDTAAVVARHAAVAPVPVRMVEERRQGLTPARVAGVRHSTGDWIAFVDDDCVLAEDWVEQVATFAREHPDCGAFGGRVVLEWEAPPPDVVLRFPYAYAGKNHGDRACRRPWIAGAGMVVRRAALADCGWIDRQFLPDRIGKRLVSGGDMEMSLRVAARHPVWYNPAAHLRHVIPPERTTRAYLRRMVIGLGASRHDTTALTWRGRYPGWLAVSALILMWLVLQGAGGLLRDALRRPADADALLSFGPAIGWWHAIAAMWSMDSAARRRLLGCAVPLRRQGTRGT